MQHGRNTQRLADGLQAGPGHFGGFGPHQTSLSGGHGSTTGDHHQDVVLNKLLGQGDMAVILFYLGVVAADNTHCPADLAL